MVISCESQNFNTMETIKNFSFLFLTLAILSCNVTKTATFDHYSYQKTTELKVESLQLIDKGTTSYQENVQQINTLLLNIEKLKEYEKNKPDNEITFAMWKILSDEEMNLLGGFFKRWKDAGQLSPAFVSEAKKQVMDAMDLLIQYEIKKDKQSKDNLMNLISNF